MNKKQILMILLVAALSAGIISLYTTFAYDEEAALLDDSTADYNLIYSIKTSSNKKISLNPYEEKYVDVVLSNIYNSNLKYGMYYKLMNVNDNIVINITDDSQDLLGGIINAGEIKMISLKIRNESDNKAELVVGALVGFVQGKIEDLQKDGEILIK